MPTRPPTISDAEWQVMSVVWDHPDITAQQIVDRLSDQTEWHARTIKTMLNRLIKKGALGYKVEGNRYLYRATAPRESCVRAESQSFVQRVFAGDAGSAALHFAEQANLSPEQIAELRQIIRGES